MRTSVYVDAFNLYYGCLKRTPYRWLNIQKLCEPLLPKNDILGVKYFTALVSARPNDPDQPVRQQTDLRALRTLPTLPTTEIVLGHYLTHNVWMPKVVPPGQPQEYVEVIKTEEKGSDVNLATHLLNDAHHNRFNGISVSRCWRRVSRTRAVDDLGRQLGRHRLLDGIGVQASGKGHIGRLCGPAASAFAIGLAAMPACCARICSAIAASTSTVNPGTNGRVPPLPAKTPGRVMRSFVGPDLLQRK